MKRLFKLMLCLFALSAAALTAAYFYVTNENVQRAFVLKQLEENFGDSATLQSFKMNLSSLIIKDLSYKNEQINFEAKELVLKYKSPLSLLSNEFNIENIELKDACLLILEKTEQESQEPAQSDLSQISEKSKSQPANDTANDTASQAQNQDREQSQSQDRAPNREQSQAQSQVANTQILAEKSEESFLDKLLINIDNIDAKILLKNNQEKIALLDLKAQNLSLKSLKDLQNIHLKLRASQGLFDEEILLEAQVKEIDSMRKLEMLITSKRQELSKIIAEYSSDFADINLVSSVKISEQDLPKSISRKTGAAFNLDFYTKLDCKNFFQEVDSILSLNASTGNLLFDSEELNLLSNAKAKFNAQIKKDNNALSISSLDGEIIQQNELLAQVKLNKSISIENSQLANNEDLKDFADLYIKQIPYSVLRNYLYAYDFSTNEINAHLSLSLDAKKKELSIATKDEIYIKALEILKDEAILVSEVFFGANFTASIDLNQNIFLTTNLRFKESKNSELKASITAEKIADKTSARIFVSGDAITLLHTAQAHVDNVEAIQNSQLDLNLRLSHQGENLEIDDIIARLYDEDYEFFQVLSKDKLYFKNFELQNDTLKAKILAKALPFAPFKAFAKGVDATSISCDIDVEKTQDIISAKGSLSAENLSFTQDKKEVFSNVYPKIDFSAKYQGDDINTEIERFSLSYKDSQILTASAKIDANLKAENYITKATSKVDLYLPSLMKIEPLQAYNNIQSAHAELALDFDGKILKADTKLTNLKLKSEGGYIASINASAIGDFLNTDKKLDLDIKISSPNGQSDISTKSSLKASDIESIINSKNIILDDLIFLSKIASKPQSTYPKISESQAKSNLKSPEKLTLQERKEKAMAAAQKQVSKKKEAEQEETKQASRAKTEKTEKAKAAPRQISLHEKAIWDTSYNINLNANLASLSLKEEKILTNLKGKLSINKDSIKSENLRFNLLNASKGEAKLELDFDKSKEEYYQLKELALNLSNIDTAKLTLNKKTKVSLMQGLIAFDLNLNSSAHSPELLGEKIKGKATLKNENAGVIRLVNANSTIGAATEMASSLMGLAGSFFGDSVKEIAPINTLIDIFKEFKYSKLSASLTRGDNLDIVIDEILIQNEGKLAILGDGIISYDENLAIADQDLNIIANLYVEDEDLANLFDKLGIMEEESDIEGFYKGTSFEATGSLNNMQNNIMDILSESTSTGASNLLNSFLE